MKIKDYLDKYVCFTPSLTTTNCLFRRRNHKKLGKAAVCIAVSCSTFELYSCKAKIKFFLGFSLDFFSTFPLYSRNAKGKDLSPLNFNLMPDPNSLLYYNPSVWVCVTWRGRKYKQTVLCDFFLCTVSLSWEEWDMTSICREGKLGFEYHKLYNKSSRGHAFCLLCITGAISVACKI